MNADFTPRDSFQSFQADCAEELQRQRDQRWMRVSLAYALAQFAASGVTGEQMSGAKGLIAALYKLPDKEEPAKPFPKHELTVLEATEKKTSTAAQPQPKR